MTAGNVWYTGNKQRDDRHGSIRRQAKSPSSRCPTPLRADPHTAVFDDKGILWFTLQQSNMVGRLDPTTGDIEARDHERPRARGPTASRSMRTDVPWFACNGSNCLVKVDPATMALTEFKLPDPDTTVRRLDIADDGMIWFVNSSQGRLGRLDPKTGAVKEWPSPSGAKSHPYALAVVDGMVWYNEFWRAARMHSCASIQLPRLSRAGRSRRAASTRASSGTCGRRGTGTCLIHQSSTNRIILVTLPSATQ